MQVGYIADYALQKLVAKQRAMGGAIMPLNPLRYVGQCLEEFVDHMN